MEASGPLRILLTGAVLACSVFAGEPKLEPLSGAPPFPADNPPTPEKIALGKELFFDDVLSGNFRRSCSTCHKPELYFTDGFSRGWGLNETELRRKTPNLLNVGWQRSMFFDGREKTLEDQVSKPLENGFEMGLDPEEAAARIASSARYRRMFEAAFPAEPIRFALIAKAIASYERTLVSYDSDLDRYLEGDESALSAAAKRGMALFEGKAGCIECHNGPMLTDHQKHYTGVPENQGDNKPGTKYKTQSLRDVVRRYSFMHHGDFLTLDAVLDHYERGGSAPAGLEAEIEPVDLSDAEREDLVAFLGSLNGRVNELLADLPLGTDVFNVRKIPQTGEDEAAASGPVLDPNYVKKRSERAP
jgi:cytochrome c peroxidase